MLQDTEWRIRKAKMMSYNWKWQSNKTIKNINENG